MRAGGDRERPSCPQALSEGCRGGACVPHPARVEALPPGLHLRPRLLAAGVTDTELHRLRRRGTLVPIRGGAYVEAHDERLRRPEDRHALLVAGTVGRLAPGAVVSHVSAAVLHGLRVWGAPLDRVHVTRDGRSGGRTSGRLHLHVSPIEPGEIVRIDGVDVTSLTRTVIDIALTLPFEPALVIADSACARPGRQEVLRAAGERLTGRPGAAAARRVLRFADGRAESVGESRSRIAIARAGLPLPVLQWEVVADGRLLGRTDFGWPDRLTVGEFDGLVKYGRDLAPGGDPAAAVVAEKVREDALRAEGLGVVRWGWRDLDDFEPVAERLRRSFALA